MAAYYRSPEGQAEIAAAAKGLREDPVERRLQEELEGAVAEGDRAVAKVRFLGELRSRVTKVSGEPADVETGEPVIEERRTAEHWTFERTLGAADPNWVLARVEPANA